jgi:hypothetical protein
MGSLDPQPELPMHPRRLVPRGPFSLLPVLAMLAARSACSEVDATSPGGGGGGSGGSELGPPTNLTYQLLPSGDPTAPDGVLLRWTEPSDSRVADYVVYSRGTTSAQWSRRGATTSNSFHDAGIPHLQYYVVAEDASGIESRGSNAVTLEERNRLPAPTTVTSITLDRAIQLAWTANARTGSPTVFDYYRVYSTLYNLDKVLEGQLDPLIDALVEADAAATEDAEA